MEILEEKEQEMKTLNFWLLSGELLVITGTTFGYYKRTFSLLSTEVFVIIRTTFGYYLETLLAITRLNFDD